MDLHELALRFLAGRSRTCREVLERLMSKGAGREEAEAVIQELRERHWLDDVSYGEQYFRVAGEKGRSVCRMKQELFRRGVSREDVREALERWEEEAGSTAQRDMETALREARKLAGGEVPDQKTGARIARRLSGLGYSSAVITKVLARCRQAREEEGS